MKRLLLILSLTLYTFSVSAQDITDAVRYSSEELSGTARFMSMSGAFGALGGDMSAIGVNPAGSAVFLNDKVSLSLGLEQHNNTMRAFGGETEATSTGFYLEQIGGVFVFNNFDRSSAFNKFTIGIEYEQTQNFNNELFGAGLHNQSISGFFLNKANGVPLKYFTNYSYRDLGTANLPSGLGNYNVQTAYLGYQAFIFDAEQNKPGNTEYTSNVAGNSFYQEYSQTTEGANKNLTINIGTQIKDNLYLGVNINTQYVNYQRVTSIYEQNQNAASSDIDEIYFENTLNTYGTGLSFQVGAIYSLNNLLRLGFSYTSPTWYTLNDETVQYLESYSGQEGLAVADPGIVNVFPEYQLRTPGKYTGSIAMVFGRSGLISVDYSYQDFSNIKFNSEFGNPFSGLNQSIENTLKGVSTIRVGGEYRIRNWSLRGGFHYQSSPYQNDMIAGDLTGYSAGLGYDFGGIAINFAYAHSQRDYNQRLYQTGFSDASVESGLSNYVLSLSFGL